MKLFRNYTDFLNTPSSSQKRRCFSPKRPIHYYNNGAYNKVPEPGLEGYSLDPRYDQNTVRDSGNVKWDTDFDYYSGSGKPQCGHVMQSFWGK